MLPDPLHPAIVHIPMALAILLPLLALCAAVAIQTRLLPARAWSGIVLMGLVLVLTSWIALETGEHEEERVERVVAEEAIEEHEEAAESFMVLGAVLFFVSIGGLIDGKAGQIARPVSVLLALGLLASGLQVGHRGGALVYEYGAAQAYMDGAGGGSVGAAERDHDEHDDD